MAGTAFKYRSIFLSVAGVAVAIAIIGVILFVKSGPFYRQDLKMHIINVGDMELQSVTVQVTGGTYEMGSIVPGKKATVTIKPTSESGISLSVKNLRGDVQQFDAGGYIEPNYVGDVTVEITDQHVVRFEMQTFP
jgi:hypothetical protein